MCVCTYICVCVQKKKKNATFNEAHARHGRKPADVGVCRRQTSHLAPGARVVYECRGDTNYSGGAARLLFTHFTESAGPNLVFGGDGEERAEMIISRAFQEFTKRTDERRRRRDGASSSLRPDTVYNNV